MMEENQANHQQRCDEKINAANVSLGVVKDQAAWIISAEAATRADSLFRTF
jgi:hypothetical protein